MAIGQKDFECIGNVAMHCDLPKLCIAIEESKVFDIIPLFCYGFVADVLANWQSKEAHWNLLVHGGEYIDAKGRRHNLLGLKRVWVYYAYARYLLINQFNDTANGTVQKQNDFSLPLPLKEVTDFSNKYRAMGREAFEGVQDYLCRNQSIFPSFDACDCKESCGCETDNCGCGNTKKITGVRFSTVRK